MAAQSTSTKEVSVGKTNLFVEPGKQEIVVMRLFDAPREKLFKAFTDPDLLAQWWGGPGDRKTVIDQLDLRPGGIWRFIDHDEAGTPYAFHGVYHLIEAPERMVCTFEYEGEPGHVLLQTVTFESRGSQTLLREQSVFQSVEDRDGMLQAGMESGLDDSMERLERILNRK